MNQRKFLVFAVALAMTTITFGPAATADHGSDPIVVDDDAGSGDYSSIQAAVDHAEPGDTVEVEPGTYEESIQIGKDLTLLGPNAGVSAVDGDRGEEATITSPGEDAIQLGNDAELTLDGFKVDDVKRFVLTTNVDGVDAWGDVELCNNVFRNADSNTGGYFWFRDNPGDTLTFCENLLTGNEPRFNGLRIRANELADPPGDNVEVDITGNLWDDNNGFAMNVNKVDGVIADNVVRSGDDIQNQWGFLLATETNGLEVTGNTFENLTFVGVWLAFGFGGPLEVTHNDFVGTSSGVLVGSGQDIADTAVHFNSFEGNDVAVQNQASSTLDATHNWWGSPLGPTTNSTTSPITGDSVEGPVDASFHCVTPLVQPLDEVAGTCTAQEPVHGTGVDH